MLTFFRFALVLALGLSIVPAHPARACTGFFIKAKDGGVAYARSLEFVQDVQSTLTIVPRGTAFAGETPDGANGLKWKTKYGFVGMDAFGSAKLLDGMNEKGLLVAMFYFPGFFDLPAYAPEKAATSIAASQLSSWLLGNFASVDEVRRGLGQVNLVPTVLKEMGISPPGHFLVLDASGAAIVVEPVKNGVMVHDNPAHVITNAPSFDWHLTNLRQYVKLSNENVDPAMLGQFKVAPLGSGSGMVGVPGDITPPSRFVRAAYYVNQLPEQETVEKALNTGMRLLKYFFITEGMVAVSKDGHELEYTQWETYADLKNLRYYFTTYDNINIRELDIKKLNFEAGPIKQIDIHSPQKFIEINP